MKYSKPGNLMKTFILFPSLYIAWRLTSIACFGFMHVVWRDLMTGLTWWLDTGLLWNLLTSGLGDVSQLRLQLEIQFITLTCCLFMWLLMVFAKSHFLAILWLDSKSEVSREQGRSTWHFYDGIKSHGTHTSTMVSSLKDHSHRSHHLMGEW